MRIFHTAGTIFGRTGDPTEVVLSYKYRLLPMQQSAPAVVQSAATVHFTLWRAELCGVVETRLKDPSAAYILYCRPSSILTALSHSESRITRCQPSTGSKCIWGWNHERRVFMSSCPWPQLTVLVSSQVAVNGNLEFCNLQNGTPESFCTSYCTSGRLLAKGIMYEVIRGRDSPSRSHLDMPATAVDPDDQWALKISSDSPLRRM
jgi:hypothetical protein